MRARVLSALLVLTIVAACAPSGARAAFGFVPGSVTFEALNSVGEPYRLAGGHPDRVLIGFEFNTLQEKADGNVKELSIDLPPGFSGSADAVPVCARSVFDGAIEGEECPPESQVGVVTLFVPGGEELQLPIFEIEAPPNGAIELGSTSLLKFPLQMRFRPQDGHIAITMSDIGQSVPLIGARYTLWGVPADHQNSTGTARHPFLTLPTVCDPNGLTISLRARSWQEPEQWHEAQAVGAPLEGCNTLTFKPRFALALADSRADTPTGVDMNLDVPGEEDPDGRAGAAVRTVTVSLPDGVSLSPEATSRLAACGDGEFGLATEAPPACPAESRVGTVEIVSPSVRDPVTGALYLGSESPGERFRFFVDAPIAGADLKLVGLVHPNPTSGQLFLSLVDIPQMPFTRMTLHLEGGARALLVTPIECGTATVSATVSSYNGDVVVMSPSAGIQDLVGGPCQGPPPLTVALSGGARIPIAGRPTGFSMTLRRGGGGQMIERFRVALPLGLSARLGTIETCNNAAAAAASCPDASRIGSAVAEMGSGQQPAVLQGGIYLTGPYGGAPYGLVLIFDAQLGPFRLGSYSIRASVEVDPRNGQVTIATDPLPATVAGVSVRFQTIGLDIDRPGFVANPTSCKELDIAARVLAVDGREAATSVPFSVTRCETQPFRPRISLSLLGRKLDREDAVGFGVGLRLPRGGTNLRGVRIRLPAALRLSLRGPPEICSRSSALDAECPAGSRVGSAFARTPLLSAQLKGGVYAAQPPGRGLPDLWIVLRGQGLRIAERVKTSNRNGTAYADLVRLPDVPISDLHMRLTGHGSGVFRLRSSLCSAGLHGAPMSVVVLEGHDGADRIERVPIRHRSCGGPQGRRRGAGGKRADG